MIAVVIPCYKTADQIISLIKSIGSEVNLIYVVDDFCPMKTGLVVESNVNDSRVRVIYHPTNQGVGAAVMTGYSAAIADGAIIIVKIDGDGQMDPSLIPSFIHPIIFGLADYTKGNRFFNIDDILGMPKKRIFGNTILSFITKISSGYWNLFDPTNGYTAIHSNIARNLPFDKISNRYFFESDMLFRLNILRAVVMDIPMRSKYDNEISSLRISKILFEFIYKHIRNFLKRIFYNYYLRGMSLASIELPLGALLLIFGITNGALSWLNSLLTNSLTPAGTVMLSALPILMGLQFLLAFLNYDINSVPRSPLHKFLTKDMY
jgi:glycosyltransferase involved in cell wall biosynthesis